MLDVLYLFLERSRLQLSSMFCKGFVAMSMDCQSSLKDMASSQRCVAVLRTFQHPKPHRERTSSVLFTMMMMMTMMIVTADDSNDDYSN
jgi:hypothetical protein